MEQTDKTSLKGKTCSKGLIDLIIMLMIQIDPRGLSALHVNGHYFKTPSSLKPLGKPKPIFKWSFLSKEEGGGKSNTNGSVHMSKMVAMPICPFMVKPFKNLPLQNN